MKVTACISDAGDDRLSQTLYSLGNQTRPPDEVLIERRGTVAGSRNLMFREAKGDILVFLDTDQEAPPDWLRRLTAGIANGWVDFTCGPTRPHPAPEAESRYESYFAEIERRHYILCDWDQTAFPMGNSAWSRAVLEKLSERVIARWHPGHSWPDLSRVHGDPFDERFTTGGEDYDINIRATALGYLGLLVPDAWVWHDQSDLDNPFKIMRKKVRYCYGGALAQLKNGHLPARLQHPRPTMRPYLHWLEGFQKVAQVTGLTAAAIKWRSYAKAEATKID